MKTMAATVSDWEGALHAPAAVLEQRTNCCPEDELAPRIADAPPGRRQRP
jgi:hypothetical protein